eukprot:3864197-Alexandrium_andersonii.AAC.1
MSLRPVATSAVPTGAASAPAGSLSPPAPGCGPGARARSASGPVRPAVVTSGWSPAPGPRADSGASGSASVCAAPARPAEP